MKIKKIISICLASAMAMSVMPFNICAAAKTTTITVGGNGCDYTDIQSAIDSVTGDLPVNISIQPGVYTQEVKVDKPNIRLINADKSKEVIITYDKANGHSDPAKNFGTDKTATVTVTENASGFEAHNITFKNSYNIDTENDQTQAVALETLADKVILEGCKIIARQDTLYLKGASKGQNVYGSANNARVYVKDCYIEGTVDFIFGDATAYFDNCDLYMHEYKNGGHFTAPNTTLFNIGYVFNNCRLSVSDRFDAEAIAKIDLGRPWQCDAAYPNSGSNSVFINCTMPKSYNQSGFSLWDSNTVANKVRFYEYGSNTDLSQRADFVKILNDEQASAYNVYNVLRGNDDWTPAGKKGVKSACDITLNEYNVSVPKGESYQLKAFALPADVTANVKYTSDNEAVASVDSSGNITAVTEGSVNIKAALPNGLTTTASVNVTAPRTDIPTVKSLKITSNSSILPGNLIKADYSYSLDSDNAIDAAIIRWYAVKDNNEYLIKEGIGESFKTYVVQTKDVGYKIKAQVLPAAVTTYGEYGAPVSYTSPQAVTKGSEDSVLYVRENFDNGITDFTATGAWNTVSNGYNNFVTANSDENNNVSMFYSKGGDWDNISFEGRYRFNPTEKGLASDGVFNIYFNYSEAGYYRLMLGRGSNTKSLKLYLYKKSGDTEEELLAKDETSLKNNIYQNSGEDNPYFTININKNKGNINIDFKLEKDSKKLASLSAIDDNPNITGTIGYEAIGAANVVLIDSFSVEGNDNADFKNKIKLYLLGDSTAKNYGDDNTIGGWGEYLVNYVDSNVEIINKAEGGRSARSYLNQGRLKEVTDVLQPDDYVFVQFGTNDQRTDDNAFMEHAVILGEPDADGKYPAIPGIKCKTPQNIYDFYKDTQYPYGETFYPYESGTFKWYMKQHIDAVKKTGATPVLLTPMCRMFFDSEGKITPHFGEDDGYITAIRQLAEEEDIMCLDMYDITKGLYESYGILTTQGLHNIKSDGTIDLTHYNKFGANLIASKMSEDIKTHSELPISAHIINSSVTVERTADLKTADLFVVGGTFAKNDDTADYAVQGAGFGDYLQKYLNSKITVKNLGVPGSTAKTYAETQAYKTLMDSVNEGDYVILSFGNDDGKYAGDSYSTGTVDDKGSFAYYMYNNYIKPLHDKNVIVIALTPFALRSFEGGAFKEAPYEQTDTITQLVIDNGLYFVNTYDVTKELYSAMGEEGSKVLNAYERKSGIMSNVLSEFGADLIAKRILSNLKFASISLKDYALDDALNTNSKITRADFVTMAMNLINTAAEPDYSLTDVPQGKYYTEAIAKAMGAGILSSDICFNCGFDKDTGKPLYTFKPEETLTLDVVVSFTQNIFRYMSVNGNMEDVYNITKAGSELSPELGLWAIDRLYEELNK